jgi:hypothetical protein
MHTIYFYYSRAIILAARALADPLEQAGNAHIKQLHVRVHLQHLYLPDMQLV